jgi:hypothetical protein
LAAPSTFAASILSIDPVSQNTTVGDSFSFNVRIDTATDLAGYQFDLFYNPALVSLQSILAGTVFNPLGEVFIAGIDDLNGTISATASVLIGPSGVNTTNGLLTVFTFQALAQGNAAFSIDNILLTDSQVQPILPGTAVGGNAVIGPNNAIPEPSTMVLSAGAFVGVWILRRRRA